MFNYHILLISLISTIIFGVIDATIFLIGEETLQKILRQSFNFDIAMAELATGGFAAAVSIFIATFVSESIESKYKTIDHPLIDAMGIILGTIFIILIYKFFLKNNNT
uniref:Uncharacterized protein n=1 Tax=viral metagenome TaxID=1070528 RepID=A0A6C0CX11_9ZZZZ